MTTLRTARSFVPLIGAVTAATTAVGAATPALAAPTVADAGEGSTALALAGAVTDGTYESCSAFFAFGKDEGFADVVGFDVEVQDPVDDSSPVVPDDVQVILVIETEGGTIECEPEEITEEQWNEFLDTPFGEEELPTYPGPGHYVYPSVALEPSIDGFGPVESVGFRVVGVPDGLTLVSPPGVQPLEENVVNPFDIDSGIIDPRVLALIEAEAGSAARDAFEDAVDSCTDEVEPIVTPDLEDAVEVVFEYVTGETGGLPDIDCTDLYFLSLLGSYKASIEANATYVEVITLAGPPSTTTTTVATTTTAAAAAAVTPRFTG